MTSKKNENIEKLKEEAAQIKNSKLSKVPKVESYSPVHPSKFLMEDEEKDFFKKSILYSLSSILKRWKKKEFVLNFFNNTLLIRKKGKEKLLYLINYSVKKLGKFKKKWCFSLINLKIHQRKYIVGCEDQEVLESWCKSIGDIGVKLFLQILL